MIVQCPELFIYERFFEYLLLLDNVLQEEQKLNNLSPKEFDIQQGFMLFERRTTDIVMAETIALVLTDKSSQL